MDKPISSLMEKDLITVYTEDSLEKIESVLDFHDLTYVSVVDMQGAIFGIITAHDLLHFHAMKKNPKAVYAWEICTHRPIEVSADTPVLDVARLMVDKCIHHVLVTENGALKGILSSFDLVAKYMLPENDRDRRTAQKKPYTHRERSASTPFSYTY